MLFAITRSGIPDGLHVNDHRNVWSAEYDGIVVRDPRGRELGFFNAEVLVKTHDAYLVNGF